MRSSRLRLRLRQVGWDDLLGEGGWEGEPRAARRGRGIRRVGDAGRAGAEAAFTGPVSE